MNRFLTLLAVCGMLLVAAMAGQAASAQTNEPLSEDHINRIRQNCVNAKTTLDRLHVSDALLRYDRGKLYEQISTKLMAPLNSRIAINRLEGLKLTALSLEYDNTLDDFRASYQQYDEAMTQALAIDCASKPAEFYESVANTREKRQKLHSHTLSLNNLLQSYKNEFEAFVKKTEGAAK
jgi:hypothetical protein